MITPSALRPLASPLLRCHRPTTTSLASWSLPTTSTTAIHHRTYTSPSSPSYYATRIPKTSESFVPHEMQNDWTRSDLYHNAHLIPQDSALEFALKNSDDHQLPTIGVSAAQGKFLNLVARSIQAKRVLEVGTLGGYSTIWLARALPADGKLITCELEQKHADIARENLERAGVLSKVEIIVGPAIETLASLSSSSSEPFDFAFIDADKENNASYFNHAKKMVKKGGVIIVDNVVRRGRVANPSEGDSASEGCRKLLRCIQQSDDVSATTIATVGEKGHDGFLYAIVL